MRIVAAAISRNGVVYSVPAPGRHDNIFRKMAKENPDVKTFRKEEQGFLTEDGVFLRRQQAAFQALKSGQIEKLNWPPLLYSEDLW